MAATTGAWTPTVAVHRLAHSPAPRPQAHIEAEAGERLGGVSNDAWRLITGSRHLCLQAQWANVAWRCRVASEQPDGAGRLTGIVYPNQVGTFYQLAGDGTRTAELQMLNTPPAASSYSTALGTGDQHSYTYTYDPEGGLQKLIETVQPTDGGAPQPVTVAQYVTDSAGRRQSETHPGLTLWQQVEANAAVGYGCNYQWDTAGHLVQASSNAGQVEGFLYDGLGLRRQLKETQGAATPTVATYTWGQGQLWEEGTQGNTQLHYDRMGSVVTAIGGNQVLHDALNSAIGSVTPSGPVLYRNDAWGGYRLDMNHGEPQLGGPTLGYAGMSAGPFANYAQQRWQDPVTGTWLSEDPVGGFDRLMNPMGLGTFLYGSGSPLDFTDPFGTDAAALKEEARRRCAATPGCDMRYGAVSTFEEDPELRQYYHNLKEHSPEGDDARATEMSLRILNAIGTEGSKLAIQLGVGELLGGALGLVGKGLGRDLAASGEVGGRGLLEGATKEAAPLAPGAAPAELTPAAPPQSLLPPSTPEELLPSGAPEVAAGPEPPGMGEPPESGGEPPSAGGGPVTSGGQADIYRGAQLKESYAKSVIDELTKMRRDLGLVSAKGVPGVIAQLEFEGRQALTGWSKVSVSDETLATAQELSRLDSPNGAGVQFQFLRHAEGDVYMQAVQRGWKGGRARLFITREPCPSCQDVLDKKLVDLLDLDELVVHTPENPGGIVYTRQTPAPEP